MNIEMKDKLMGNQIFFDWRVKLKIKILFKKKQGSNHKNNRCTTWIEIWDLKPTNLDKIVRKNIRNKREQGSD